MPGEDKKISVELIRSKINFPVENLDQIVGDYLTSKQKSIEELTRWDINRIVKMAYSKRTKKHRKTNIGRIAKSAIPLQHQRARHRTGRD